MIDQWAFKPLVSILDPFVQAVGANPPPLAIFAHIYS